MFNTGTVVGVFANIFGSGFPRNFVPSFSWGGNKGFTTYLTKKAFEVASIVMKRRGCEFSNKDAKILKEVFEISKKYRSSYWDFFTLLRFNRFIGFDPRLVTLLLTNLIASS